MRHILIVLSLVLLAHTGFAATKAPALDPRVDAEFNAPKVYTTVDGETLYLTNCQACHMAGGKGVKEGVGMYPALANNPKLATASYAAFVVMNGLRGMPSFAGDFSDEQIAAVTNFVNSNFGNTTKEKVTLEEVKAMRPATSPSYE